MIDSDALFVVLRWDPAGPPTATGAVARSLDEATETAAAEQARAAAQGRPARFTVHRLTGPPLADLTAEPGGPRVVAAGELSGTDRAWLEADGLDLADARVTVVGDGPEALDGFDVAAGTGVVRVRMDSGWKITDGPPALLGTRYSTAGEAARAALRGWQWPAWMPLEDEPRWSTSAGAPPAEDEVTPRP